MNQNNNISGSAVLAMAKRTNQQKKSINTFNNSSRSNNINIRTEKEKLRKSAFVAQKPQNLFMLVKQKTYTRDTCKVMFILFMCVCAKCAWQWQKYYKQFLSPMNILHNFHLLDKHAQRTQPHAWQCFHVNVWLLAWHDLAKLGRFGCFAFLVPCGVVETLIWHGWWCQIVSDGCLVLVPFITRNDIL